VAVADIFNIHPVDPLDPENIGKISGRGLLLIRTFMDDVRFNSTGNEITLIDRKSTRLNSSHDV
jgi:anti-sigma regulatory factor (Ser/Thr protein kinase)